MTDRSAPPRPHYAIWSTGAAAAKIGEVVSGTQSPSLGIGIGMGYVPPELRQSRTPAMEIEIRGKRAPLWWSPSRSIENRIDRRPLSLTQLPLWLMFLRI